MSARLATLLRYTLLLAAALLFIAPLLFMLAGSFKAEQLVLTEAGGWRAFWPGQPGWHNYSDVLARVPFFRYLLNSLWITLLIVLGGLVVNALAGYAFARLQWRARNALLALVLALMIIPLEAIAVPLFYQVSLLGWRDTYLVQVVPFVANAFSIYLFYTFFIGLPRELEEAAWMDGAGTLRTFVSIIVPNSRPVFASVAILTFLTQWGAFLWPLMVTYSETVRPLPLAIATFHSLPPLQWGDIFAFGVMMVSPVLVVFVLFQRWFVRGVTATGIKG
jgi:multiple sugar transport system permease protein